VVSCNTLTNSFDRLSLPPLGGNLGWQIVYAAASVSLQVVSNRYTTAQITGSVTDTHATPVANLTVFACTTNANNSLFLSTTTDAGGNYVLNVANGTWCVGVQGLGCGYDDVPPQYPVVNNANQVVNFVVQPAGRPALAWRVSGGILLLSWPAAAQPFHLQTALNLSDQRSWVTLPVAPVQMGGQMMVAAPLLPGTHFYRLIKP